MSGRLGALRAALARRSAREGANAGVTALLLLGVVVGVNYLADRRNTAWDTTAGGRFTLAPQTLRVLEGLDREVRLVVLDQPRAAARAVELFEQYADRSEWIDWEVIDQEAEPARARAYRATAEAGIPFGTVVVASGDRQERVAAPQEADLTNAVVRLLRDETKKIYFTVGHRERSLDESGAGGLSAIRSRLEEANYAVAELSLLETAAAGAISIPDDAAAVVIPGPERDLLPAEAEALAAHLRSGGKAMLLLDPPGPSAADDRTRLLDLAGEFGITPAGDVVIDASGVGQLFGFGVEAPLAASYGFHSITRGFETAATVFPLAQSLIAPELGERPEGVTLSELVQTSDASWGERDADELESGEVTADDDDREGPLTLAWAVRIDREEAGGARAPGAEAGGEPTAGDEPPADDDGGPGQSSAEPASAAPADGAEAAGDTGDSGGEGGDEPVASGGTEPGETESGETEPPDADGRLVVVGDTDFIANDLALSPLGNADLFLNMVHWLTEDENLIAIRPRDPEDRRITMTAGQLRNLVLLALVFLPGFFLVWGVAVWWSRR